MFSVNLIKCVATQIISHQEFRNEVVAFLCMLLSHRIVMTFLSTFFSLYLKPVCKQPPSVVFCTFMCVLCQRVSHRKIKCDRTGEIWLQQVDSRLRCISRCSAAQPETDHSRESSGSNTLGLSLCPCLSLPPSRQRTLAELSPAGMSQLSKPPLTSLW